MGPDGGVLILSVPSLRIGTARLTAVAPTGAIRTVALDQVPGGWTRKSHANPALVVDFARGRAFVVGRDVAAEVDLNTLSVGYHPLPTGGTAPAGPPRQTGTANPHDGFRRHAQSLGDGRLAVSGIDSAIVGSKQADRPPACGSSTPRRGRRAWPTPAPAGSPSPVAPCSPRPSPGIAAARVGRPRARRVRHRRPPPVPPRPYRGKRDGVPNWNSDVTTGTGGSTGTGCAGCATRARARSSAASRIPARPLRRAVRLDATRLTVVIVESDGRPAARRRRRPDPPDARADAHRRGLLGRGRRGRRCGARRGRAVDAGRDRARRRPCRASTGSR